ncbi:MAG: site-specific DNA-methyltransferase, partial [Candidatus Omnitrophica bacterium]|nr:site-specific DNA-methyltransferase [Candidatus Omnitrophota bacterium]
MAKIELTPAELELLTQCVNEQKDVPAELLTKLSPAFFEKLAADGRFDYKTLDKFKIPTIEYAGKRAESIILAQAAITGGAAPLQVVRSFANGKNGDWKNLIVQGDNLQFLKTCYLNQDPLVKDKVKGKIKLVYIDPPFGTGDEYGGRGGQNSYSAKLAGSEFIEGIRERAIFLKEILSNDGIFFIRIDHHFGHYVKIILDELFGKNSFQGEIVINRIKKNVTQQGRQSLPTANDSLFVYFKSEKSEFISVFKKLCEEKSGYWRAMDSAGIRSNPKRVIEGQTFSPPAGRHFTFNQKRVEELYSAGKIRLNPKTNRPEYWVDPKDEVALDTNWTDISGYTFTTGYPTENSELLLERVISMTTENGDIVMDVFGGSGTTAAVAEKLGRRWIICDFGKHAIYTMQKRMLNITDSKKLNNGEKAAKYGQSPKPFCVVSAGAYDFTRIMDLRKNQDAYITFVLGLFNIVREKADFSKKYKLPNVYAEKNGDPVEVFPVWDDEYLKNIRIDEEYLQGIIDASGGKLKGDYYIITPETCARIGDTTLKNIGKEKVNFKLLKFPYKVLEELSRHFQIEEQAASSSDINRLISSVGFYFNEEVKVEVERKNGGIKITKFNSGILDKNGQRFKGLESLATVLVDVDYDGKIFDMDIAIYNKDIGEDGVVKVEGLTKDSHIIAIDKHG